MTQSSPPLVEPVTGRPTDLASIVRGRRSVRKLRPDPVPRDLIERAIEAAGWAPSPHGRQPWRFAVVERDDMKRKLAEAMASAWQRQLQLDGQDASVIQIRLQKSLGRVTNAPVIVVPCLYLDDLDDYPDALRREAERTMAIQSIGAAIQNLLLTVYAAGYDAGWMCGPLFCSDVVRDTLGLSKSLIPHAMIPIGVAAADPVRRPRLPIADLIAAWL
jgi:F420 biosynthesis protein FbiB-like protein